MEVEDENVYSEETLGNCSYRMLQKISKSMHLPSNVKRVYLIELILTKQNCSEEELDDLIKVIKAARKESPKKKKKDLKKISEKTDVQDKCPSPMITSTPKRKTPKQPFCLKDHETINEYKQKAPNQTNTLSRQILSPMTSNNESHRILRSSHLKKPSKIVHSNDYFDSTDTGNTLKEKDVHHKENVKSKINEMKINPKSLLKSPKNNQVVYMPRHDKKQVIHTIEINKLNPPIMTPKTLNLVYPLWPDPKSFRSNVSVKILNVKQSNGKVSKIRALVRKREIINAQRFNDKNRDLNTEPVMEVHLPNDDNYLNGNPLYVDDNVIEECNKEPKQYNFVNADFLYYNDIHGDLACCKEVSTREFVSDPTFPSNDEAFNTTENRDVTQPLHIETSDYWRKSNDFISTNTDQDKLFIANSQYDIYEPLLKIATETDSYSSYSISESSSIMVDQPSDLVIDQYITPVGTDLLNDINDVIYNEEKDNTESELFKFSQIVNSFLIQQEGKDFVDTNTSISLSDTSQETGGDITIHDMVDDAIEIINNDGFQACSDGVGNDIGVQCIFCSWAGPQDLLESHVKDEHSNMINESLNNECIIQYNLGYLMQSQLWLSEVIEHASVLYAVCIKYEDPDSLMATIAILTSNPVRGHKGAITVYNKVTGEPYMWEGMIQPLSPNMPHFNDLDGLNIGLSTLNLIPNSANLKLVNRELVNDTTSKVVVGQPELDGIHIELLPAPRQKIPKDGPGPRGAPDCYYTSRVLNSTFRYVKFVRKLRAEEEEQRKGAENKAKEAKDHAINNFFLKCDRKSLVNDVARRVDLCLASYQEDLKVKRERLKEIFAREEEENIRKFVEQVQAGAEAVWQDKKDRLQYLLAKRRKEHADKYKDTPLSKCVHVLPCIIKLRAMEAQEIQLYQMKEKQARKMAEKEFDKMWHEVTMKEADALMARMEYDAIQRLRRDMECKESTDYQIQQRRLQREREKELLKEQTIRFKAIWDEENRKEEAAQQARKEKTRQVAEDSKKFLEEKQERTAKERVEQKLVADAWDSLAGQGLANDLAMIELRKRKERELDECNKKLIELKKQFADMDTDDSLVKEDARRAQEKTDQIRCRYLKWAKDTNKEVRQAMIEQIKDRAAAREVLKKKILEEDEYNRQLRKQLDQLIEHKIMADAKARKEHQKNLLHQIEYTKVLKERARQEELDQLKKYQIATEEYEEEIKKMLCRPFFSDDIHPFMKQMAKGVKMAAKCPCSKKDYCK